MQKKKGIDARTKYRRQSQASPFFEFSNASTIATNGTWVIDIGAQDRRAQKHLPMSNIRIVNNSGENIAFYPNQTSEAINVPAGTIISFDRLSIPALVSVKLQNLSAGTVQADEIKVSVWREGVEIDSAFQKMHKAFFNFLHPSSKNII